jgi:DNA-directed RNA polymerase subunit beta'
MVFDTYGQDVTVSIADAIKNLWFAYSTKSGTSINLFAISTPTKLQYYLDEWDTRADKIYTAFHKWLLSAAEKHRLVIQSWTDIKDQIEQQVKKSMNKTDDLFMMIDSW